MTKPAVGSTVLTIRDIERGAGTDLHVSIPSGTTLTVTDDMARAGYRKAQRIGVRVPNTDGMSIGVELGTDVIA